MRFIEGRPFQAQAHARNIPQNALVVAAAAILALVLLSPGLLFAEGNIAGEIIIEGGSLDPDDLVTQPEHRVSFINQSGEMVHIEFHIGNGDQHHVFQVSDRIWAVFHRTGRHPYVVHFPGSNAPPLHGLVEIVGDPLAQGRPDPRMCGGVTVQGACIEQ